MTSVFRLLIKNFDPPATVDSAGVRPASEHVAVEDIPTLKRDFARLAQVSRRRRHSGSREPTLTVALAAGLLGVSQETVRSLASAGALKMTRTPLGERYCKASAAALYERIHGKPIKPWLLGGPDYVHGSHR